MARTPFKWRKWNNILHRDIGYLAVGVTLVYAISGIALNHIADWNPSYSLTRTNVQWEGPPPLEHVTEDEAIALLERYGEEENFKKHYYPHPNRLKIFLKGGSVEVDMITGHGIMETVRKRPVFFEVNYLHYNPRRLWTWFSDAYCAALILVTITGLFVLKGKKGITGRGAWLTAIGIAMPIGFLIWYL